MSEKFLAGVVLGMFGGALIVANSVKVSRVIKQKEQQVVDKIEDFTKKTSKKSGK